MAGGVVSGVGTASPVAIVGNIFVSFIGAGVLGLPYAFMRAGIVEGVVTMVVVAVLAVRAMLMLIECKYTILSRAKGGRCAKDGAVERQPLVTGAALSESDDSSDYNETRFEIEKRQRETQSENITYGEVGLYAAGPLGQHIVESAMIVSQVGFCCAYLIFIGDNLASMAPTVGRHVWLMAMLPFLYMLTLYRQLHKLAGFSLFAQCTNVAAFAVVLWFDFEHIAHATNKIHPHAWSTRGFPFFVAVAIYCYEGAGMILTLEYSLAKHVRHKFRTYFLSVITVITCMYVGFGACGYMSFGDATNAIITLNLPAGEDGLTAATFVKLCLCASLFFTYPVMMFPVSELLQRKWLHAPDVGMRSAEGARWAEVRLACPPSGRAAEHPASVSRRRHRRHRHTHTVVRRPHGAHRSVGGNAVHTRVAGATCCTLLAFILPAWFHLKLHARTMSSRQEALNWLLICFGVLGAILGTVDTLNNIAKAHRTSMSAVAPPPLDVPHVGVPAFLVDDPSTTTTLVDNRLAESTTSAIDAALDAQRRRTSTRGNASTAFASDTMADDALASSSGDRGD